MVDQRKQAAIYCRISSDRVGAGLGVERQERECRELAQTLGWDVVEVYVDNDVSAFNRRGKDVDWRRLLKDLKTGLYDAVLAWHVDRMYRRPRDLDALIEVIEQRKIPVRTVTSGLLDLSNPAGVAMAKVSAVFAEYESAQKGERQRSKHRELALAGKGTGGGTRPFGYEDDRVTVRESEAMLIREATRRILDNGQSLSGLVKEWNEQGISTVTGTRWNTVVMRRLMVSARISGRREYHRVHDIGEITNNNAQWAGIISHEDSDRLRELLTDPARQTNFTDGARKYLLTGFLFCHCGQKMIARPQGDHQRSYICLSPELGSHTRMHAESVEVYTQEAVLDYIDEFVNLAHAIRPVGNDHMQESKLWAELQSYETRLTKLESDYYVHERLDERTFIRLSDELRFAIMNAKKGIDKIRGRTVISNLPTSSGHARVLWDQRGLEWRRLLISALVERVTVGPGVRGRNRFDPDRVSIVYRRPE